MMFEKQYVELNGIKQAIFEAVSKSQDATTVNMGKNAILFLDTAYMWLNTLDQVIASRQETVENAVPTGVIPGDFTPKG